MDKVNSRNPPKKRLKATVSRKNNGQASSRKSTRKISQIKEESLELENSDDEPLQIKQERIEKTEIKQEFIEGGIDTLDGIGIRTFTSFECHELNCKKCKEQQVGYCFLHFHICLFSDNKCIICCSLSQLLVGENSHHSNNATIECVFCGRTFGELPDLQEHDCCVLISKNYHCCMCRYVGKKRNQYLKHILKKHCGVLLKECKICLNTFLDTASLKQHLSSVHSTTSEENPAIESKEKQDDSENSSDNFYPSDGEMEENGVNNEEEKDALLPEPIEWPLEVQHSTETVAQTDVQLCYRETCTICIDRQGALCMLEYHNCPIVKQKGGECEVCQQITNHLALVEKEPIKHLGCTNVRCVFCLRDFLDMAELKAHDCESKESCECKHCGVMLSNRYKLSIHLFFHFDIKAYNCETCDKSFIRESQYSAHVRNHQSEPKFHCTVCTESFHKNREYQNHMFKHGTSKPHECPECHKKFAASYQLSLHQKTHERVKPYPCSKCERSFIKSRNLQHHEFNVHGTGGFQCPLCQRTVSSPVRLRKHMMGHEQTHDCHICGNSYTTAGTLKRHMRVHSNNVYKCEEEGCPYTTFYSCQLKAHQNNHAGVKPYGCDKCPARFMAKRSLISHINKAYHKKVEVKVEAVEVVPDEESV